MGSAQNDAADANGIKHPDEASVRTLKGGETENGNRSEEGRRWEEDPVHQRSEQLFAGSKAREHL